MNPQKGEHATEDFHQINPKGVIPALIHDGTLIIESTDIIDYLDSTFGNHVLRPANLEAAITESLEHASQSQLALKYCTFEFFFQHGPQASDGLFSKIDEYKIDILQQDFWHEYRNGFPRERIHDMVGRAHNDFLRLDEILSDRREWMAGNQFSLADIAWMPNFHRFDLLGWPLEIYPNLVRWFETASARPSYRKALDGWEPKALMDKVMPILDERRANRDGIDNYGPFAD